jgi:hypothetical protein|tara:strand:+ start:655 stop:879 length:225 start_codon:yes stop_codon:yes gene_type:complete
MWAIVIGFGALLLVIIYVFLMRAEDRDLKQRRLEILQKRIDRSELKANESQLNPVDNGFGVDADIEHQKTQSTN